MVINITHVKKIRKKKETLIHQRKNSRTAENYCSYWRKCLLFREDLKKISLRNCTFLGLSYAKLPITKKYRKKLKPKYTIRTIHETVSYVRICDF